MTIKHCEDVSYADYEWINNIDAQYIPFTKPLINLAEQFQSEEIETQLQRCLAEGLDND